MTIERFPIHADCVLIDTGDVLYDDTVWQRWLLHVLVQLRVHAHYRALFTVWHVDFLQRACCGECTLGQALGDFLRAVGLRRGQVDELLVASTARYRLCRRTIRPFAGVRATLARLRRQDVRLVAISSVPYAADELRIDLQRLGLADYFDGVVSSYDLRCVAPAPAYYRAALQTAACQPHEAVFVGHDAAELAGAARMGLATAAFNADPTAAADVHLDRVERLAESVQRSRSDDRQAG